MKIICEKCKDEGSLSDSKMKMSQIIHRWLCSDCTTLLDYEFEAFKREFLESKKQNGMDDDFFPPPWDFVQNKDKTEGWVEFQKEMRKHPRYYLGTF